MRESDYRFSFIPDGLFKKLPKNIKTKLNSYRGIYGNIIKEQNNIKELEIDIQKCKNKIDNYGDRLGNIEEEIDYLRNEFYFTISIIKTQQKGKHYYYMLTISRRSNKPKNCYLGSDKKIKERLLEHYKKDKDRLKLIEKDWHKELKVECNNRMGSFGYCYEKIFDLMFTLNEKFQGTTINLDTLYPLKQLKVV